MNQPNWLGRDEQLVSTQPAEHFDIARVFGILFALAGLGLAVFSGLLAFAVSAAAPVWITLPMVVAFGVAAIIAIATVRTLIKAREALRVRLWEWQEDRECARRIAELQATQNVNVQVKGRQNVVNVGAGQSVENTRLIPVFKTSGKAIENVPIEDVAYVCERAPLIGISRRAWWGERLPSGRTVNTAEIHSQLLEPFIRAGLIVGRSPRSAGALTTLESAEMKRTLGIGPGEAVREINPGDRDAAT